MGCTGAKEPCIAPRVRGSLATDTSSTKGRIVEAAVAAGLGDRFVGAHPFAGDHRGGWPASRQGPFIGCTTCVFPTPNSELAAVERAVELWRHVGARTQVVEAAEHDARMAWLSHLPQAAASALALALAQSEFDATRLGPGGRDTTRLAASSPGLGRDPARQCRRGGAGARRVRAVRRRAGEAVRHRDAPAIEQLLASAKRWLDGE